MDLSFPQMSEKLQQLLKLDLKNIFTFHFEVLYAVCAQDILAIFSSPKPPPQQILSPPRARGT